MSFSEPFLGRTGRPPLFSSERAQRVLAAVRQGMPFKQAAAYGGVSYDTFLRWKRRGEDSDSPPEFRDFCDSLRQAEGEATFRLLGKIERAAGRGNWRAASWILERRHPEIWGKKQDQTLAPGEGFLDEAE